MQLTTFPTVRYTLLEHELFKTLPKTGGPIKTNELVYSRLKKGPWLVRNPRNIVATVMAKLIKKVAANHEPFRIKQSKDKGSREVMYRVKRVQPGRAAARETSASLFD